MTDNKSSPKTPGKATADADIVSAYRAVIGRDPASHEIARFRERETEGGTLADLVRALGRHKESKENQVRLFVPPGHFYSPIVDPATLLKKIPPARSPAVRDMRDVNVDLEEMEGLWRNHLGPLAQASDFPEHAGGPARFHFANPAFGYGDAAILRAMLLHVRPQRIIEVGSGYSTACALDAIDEARLETALTCIDPYPQLLRGLLKERDLSRIEVLESPVQDVPLQLFESLRDGDFLFIDSTHVAKTGSDVVFELTEVLPRLAAGVFIHFHDIFYPFEYGYQWAIQENRSWNEIYMLRSFLAFNTAFKVVFFNDMMAQLKKDAMLAHCPDFFRNSGGSIWLKRVPAAERRN